MAKDKKAKTSSPCACSQAAADILKTVSPIKDAMLKEVKCKGCGKTFLANFETEYCLDCRKSLKGER
ncbi:MAG: hypothetical protein QXX51_02655 [Candidatus Bathyarchaeia archaeon]